MITVFRKDELLESLGKNLEALRHPGPYSNMTEKEREWMEEGIMHVMDRLEGWCSPRQRIKSYEVSTLGGSMHEHVPPDTAAIWAAADAKAAVEKAINKLLEMLEDSDPDVRLQAAALLLGKR